MVNKIIVECPICKKKITSNNYKIHVNSCFRVRYRIFKTKILSSNPEGKKGKTGRVAWNKGLTRNTDERVNKNSENISNSLKGKKRKPLSDSHKKSISEARTKYLINNPDKVPYRLNHYSKGPSYPEKYWKSILDFYGIIYEQEFKEGLYSLDFKIGNIDLEIDGDQHYLDERIVESDIRRSHYLENLGYKIIRIKWSDYQKLPIDERKTYVYDLINKFAGAFQ